MFETWLRTNRRAILLGCVPPVILTAIGACLAVTHRNSGSSAIGWIGYVVVFLGAASTALLLTQLRNPRIAFCDGMVLFYVRLGKPISVPVELVESFFFGQGPSHLPTIRKQLNTVNLIARLSQRHTEWASQRVRPGLANWSGGYVTIRGTWCEPLNSDLIRRINRRLKEVKDTATTQTSHD